MSTPHTRGAFGVLVEPTTLQIERLLPGPIERVWSYLTTADLRRKWLAAGEMELKAGGAFELIWRNDELTSPSGKRPDEFGEEHRMIGRILACDPPHKLAFTWGSSGDVTIALAAKGADVLLTITHRRLPNRDMLLKVSAGWHAHLDLLVATLTGEKTAPFWDEWASLKAEYDRRLDDTSAHTEGVAHA